MRLNQRLYSGAKERSLALTMRIWSLLDWLPIDNICESLLKFKDVIGVTKLSIVLRSRGPVSLVADKFDMS